ncbi:Hypothetical_protein [Hexamita inflata]|uniref:Hypothetical_protein n=1 Tax=Hexamita inflata TaxID=28002 RepID=A0AA86UFY2_9EUKA|nr:Hypothetical protein HINF_LOCUS44265 [Hexamita inflata]
MSEENSEFDFSYASSTDSIVFNFNFEELPDIRKNNRDTCSYIQDLLRRQKFDAPDAEFSFVNSTVYINSDYINRSQRLTLRLYLNGLFNDIKYTFNPRGLSLVIKQIDVIQLNNCAFALDQLIVHARDISFQNCDISGDSQQFTCNNFHLCITGLQRIDWLRADKCLTIMITINEFYTDFYKELTTLSQIQNLNQLCIYDSTLDLQKIDVSQQQYNNVSLERLGLAFRRQS